MSPIEPNHIGVIEPSAKLFLSELYTVHSIWALTDPPLSRKYVFLPESIGLSRLETIPS